MSRPNRDQLREQTDAGSFADANSTAPKAPSTDGAWRAHLLWLRTSLCRRFGPDLADDLAQETYLRVVGRDATGQVRNPRGLLMTIAGNLARDRFRRERVRVDHAAEAARAEGPAGRGPWTAADDLEVREAILSLPPRLRDVLLLSKIGGLTNREIAQRYSLSVRAIDKRLQKAIALFVAHLRD